MGEVYYGTRYRDKICIRLWFYHRRVYDGVNYFESHRVRAFDLDG